MKYIFYFFVFSTFLVSCTKGPLILSPQEKLQGEWIYTKAVFIQNAGFTRNNVLHDFADWRVYFSGSDVRMEDLRYGDVLDGYYELYKVDNGGYYDENGNYISTIENYIGISVWDKNNERYDYEWRVSTLTRNNLWFGEYYADGNYSFKMEKINP